MDLNDLLQRYFGTSDTSELSQIAREAGLERIRVDFGLESDRGKRFALWGLLSIRRRRGSRRCIQLPTIDPFRGPRVNGLMVEPVIRPAPSRRALHAQSNSPNPTDRS
jgi:hypothetical protein